MKSNTLIALLLAGVAAPLTAQTPDTIRFNEIVVTATKLPLPRAATTAAVTVLQADALRQRGARTVADALRLTPSASVVQAGSIGSITSLFLRGGESDYVQVLIDGVRVNNPGGVYDFGNLTLDNIERIEIVRGPVSVLYGSDAVTGVVQIFTKRGGNNHWQVRATGAGGDKVSTGASGRYATSALGADIADRHGNVSYAAGIANTRSDGLYAFNNQYRNTTASLSAGVDLDGNTKFEWSARFTDSRFHYPTDGSGNLVDRNQFRTTEAFTSALNLTRRWSALSATARAGVHQNYERYTDERDAPTDTLGTPISYSRGRVRRAFAELGGHYNLGSATLLSGGVELEQQEDRNRYASEGQFGPFNSSFGKERTNRGIYLQAVHGAGRFTLNAGGRGDFNDRFGNFLTYRAGVAYRIAGGTRVRAAAGTAFKEPTFFENYAEGFTKGNAALEPEHTRTVEAGIEHLLSARLGVLQMTYFKQQFRDLIQYVPRPFGSTESNYENLARARADGFELEWNAVRLGALELAASYTALQTEALETGVEDPAFEAGEELLRRPRNSAAANIAYNWQSATVDAGFNYVGKRSDLSFARFPFSRVTLPSYTTVDAGLAWHTRAARSWPITLTARLHNLLDERYEEVLNFPARGRTFQIGIEAGR